MSFVSEQKNSVRKKIKRSVLKMCSVKTVKKRLPIIQWLPKYSWAFLIQDIAAGITVGLTAIPQGIAYAVLAGLSPEYGLYASLTSGFVYIVFGSCKTVTVGPTAILASMVAKYVNNYSADFAILAAFLSGVIQLAMGVLQLGFLVKFISHPVISGFTTAAALQIASSQLKPFLGLSGASGNYFAESMYSFFKNIKTAKLWEAVLSTSTIVMLLLLQKLGQGCKMTDPFVKKMKWFMAITRNALVVIVGMIIAFILKKALKDEPLALVGDINKGLPDIKLPPFNTVVKNETLSFLDMLEVLGPQSIALPFVAILESVAIAKAFSCGVPVDATQELIALGLCNIIGSFAGSMPITGSFTRTALNHASGVQTQAGGVTKCLLLIFALSVLTSTFYFIPKASLAGLIMTAMFSMIDFEIFVILWKSCKKDLFLLIVTMIVCMFFGLEYGIVVGIILEALLLLFFASRLTLNTSLVSTDSGQLIVIPLVDNVPYCAAENIRSQTIKLFYQVNKEVTIVFDGTHLRTIDSTVAYNLVAVVTELSNKSVNILFLNFASNSKMKCLAIEPKFENKFVTVSGPVDLLLLMPKDV